MSDTTSYPPKGPAVTEHSKLFARVVTLVVSTAATSLVGCDLEPVKPFGGAKPPSPSETAPPLSELVGPGAPVDYTIAAGETFAIDKSYTVDNLMIHGKLYCRSDIAEPITITARSITVDGPDALFECGAGDNDRFHGKITILLADDGAGHEGHNHGGASATLSVSKGGTLRMFGDRLGNFGWQRIAADVPAKSSTVTLEAPVGWKVGDLVALGPSGFNFNEAEEREIASVSADGRSITVRQPFSYNHRAFTKEYAEGNRRALLDERPEIANLSRNIVVSTAGNLAAVDVAKRGAQVVIEQGGKAYVDGVELARGGKLGVLAEYPFHWHLAGNVSGQFLRNSSIHHTFQRCVTIHGTNYAEVSNNVCFDHLGHGYFLENGNEVKNVLRHNLGMLSRRIEPGKGLLDSDMRSRQPLRFSAPATFWVTNPDNEITGNVASGSEGTGFWMAFSNGIRCGGGSNPNECEGPAGAGVANTVFPSRTSTLRFAENIAHSSIVGINWDGAEDGELVTNSDKPFTEKCKPGGSIDQCRIEAKHPLARETVSVHYAPPTPAVFDSLQVWKNVATGVYFRGSGGTFTNFLAADNGRSLFFAYDQSVKNGLVVGASEGVTAEDVAYAKGVELGVRLYAFAGTLIYDGPFGLQDVHFADFQDKFGIPAGPFLNIGGANRSVNRVQHVTFGGGVPLHRVYLDVDTPWADTPWTTALRDDGSITGAPGLLLPDHPMNASAGECASVGVSSVDKGLSCSYTWGVMTFAGSTFKSGYDANRVPIKFERIERSSGAIVTSDALRPDQLSNKSGMISGLRYRYRLSLSQAGAEPVVIRWVWQPEDGKVSPIVEIDGVAAALCHPKGATQVSSLAALDTAASTAYRWENGNLYMRVSPYTEGELFCGAE